MRGAFFKTVAGADRKSTATRAEKRVIAVHEAGHALASIRLTPENRLKRVSILPAGGGAAGYNLSIPPERAMLEKRQIECQIEVLLAGRAAELLVGGDDAVTAGAANDLSRAAELAAALVMDLGMAGEPAVSLRALSRACGGGDEAKALCRQKLGELFANVSDLLLEHADELLLLTDALVEREAMSGEEVEVLLRAA